MRDAAPIATGGTVSLVPSAQPLPPELLTRPFTVAEAVARGVPAYALRRDDLRVPFAGVRVPAALPDDLAVLARAALLVLPPGSAIAGRTAVQLLGLPQPLGAPPVTGPPVSAAVPPWSTGAPAVPGVVARHRDLEGKVVLLDASLPVLAPPHLFAELAGSWPLADAVALGDAVLARGASAAALAAAVDARAGHRGVVAARQVLARVRSGVDSAMETRSRLLFVAGGLPEPVCGHEVVVRGEWLAQIDMAWVGVRVAAEFDGDQHRTSRRQWQDDVVRRRLLEEAGWIVVVFTARDLLRHPDDLVRTVAAALRRRGLVW